MGLLDFSGGAVPRTPYQLERDIEDALEGGNARWEEAHNEDGTHKAFPDIDVDEDATIGGDLLLTGGLAFADHIGLTLTADLHNAKQADGRPYHTSVMRISAAAARTITGIVPYDTDAFQLLRVLNVSGGSTLTLAHQSGSSLSANRFSCPLDGDFALLAGMRAELLYDPSSGVWRVSGALSMIKNIQRGTITIANGVSTATATITAVVTAKTELRHLGVYTSGAGDAFAHLNLTNTTTITATRKNAVDDTNVGWEVTERY
jgi:hypothetical protein